MDKEVELFSIAFTLRLRDLYEAIVSEAEASACSSQFGFSNLKLR